MPEPDPDPIAELTAAVRELAQRVDGQCWPRWLSVEAAARYTSLSSKSIRNMVAAGRVTPSRAVRGKVLIDRLQLDAALSAECGARLRRGRGIQRHAADGGSGRERPAATTGTGA
jgi:excisionase family DNA binding protein